MKFKTILALTAIALLVSCASPPKQSPPKLEIDMPEDWTSGHPARTDTTGPTSRWWENFNDSTLNSVVEEALRNNYNIRIAASRVEAAAALARIEGADLFPNANLGFQSSRRRQNIIGIPIPFAPDVIKSYSSALGVSLDIAWEVDLWGRIASGKSAALADLQAGWADLAATRLSIAAQTVKAWFALIEAKLQVQLARETVESYRLSSEQVRSRYLRGIKTALDARLAMANLASARSLLEARRIQLDQAKRQLEILLGHYPAGSIKSAETLPKIRYNVPVGIPSGLLLRRPDLLAAERRYASSRKRVSAARRAFFPRITLTGSGGTLSNQLKDLLDGNFIVWNIASGITQPLFQGGRLRANLAQSKSAADEVLATYALALLNAFGEVEAALFAEQALGKQEEQAMEAAMQSEAARKLAERQYREGLVDYITVLETQRRALNSQSELISITRQRLDARINLHLALGGGFDVSKEWGKFLQSLGNANMEESLE